MRAQCGDGIGRARFAQLDVSMTERVQIVVPVELAHDCLAKLPVGTGDHYPHDRTPVSESIVCVW